MTDISFLERISKIFGLITSPVFFISLLLTVVFTITFIFVNKKLNSKIPKVFVGAGYLIIILFIIFRYGTALFNVQDGFTDKVFNSFYFPNLVTYVSMIIISIFVITMDFLNKNKTLPFKIISVVSFGIILSLFVITLDIITKNEEIEIFDATTIYSNTDLMIIIQATTAVFCTWIVIELVDYFSKKISLKVDKNSAVVNEPVNINYNNQTVGDYQNKTKETYMNNYYNTKNNNGYYNYTNYGNYGNYTNSGYNTNSNYNYNYYSTNDTYSNQYETNNNYTNLNTSNNSYNNQNKNYNYNTGAVETNNYNYDLNTNVNFTSNNNETNNSFEHIKRANALSNNFYDDNEEEGKEYKKVHYLEE